MYILGIETSCDETSAAVISSDKKILSNIIFSQIDLHQKYGGVVPEIASRSHLESIELVIEQALREAKIKLENLDAIAVTSGPGLVGGLIVGIMVAKALAYSLGIKIIEINHLEGHILSARIFYELEFPFLAMLASGGHCQILEVKDVGNYQKLGGTIDDAAGEAFDKVAKMLGLTYPGGPIIEKYALEGDEKKFKFPVVFKNKPGCDFSFSGLKTAVRNIIQDLSSRNELNLQAIKDICASFQYVVAEIFSDRIANSLKMFRSSNVSKEKYFILVGGVAANNYIKKKISAVLQDHQFTLIAPPMSICTDNAAMIGWAGMERLKLNMLGENNFEPKARWPLESLAKEKQWI